MKRWLDPWAIALAAVLAVAAALPSITTCVFRRDYYFFDVALTSSSVGTTQVFWDIGRGFNEYDSSRQPLRIERTPVVYRYMMPMGRIQALRFDPIDGIGDFTFSNARIVDSRGTVVREFAPGDFKAFSGIQRMEPQGRTLRVQTARDTHDPILTLNLPQPVLLRSNLRIWFELGWPVALPVLLAGLLLGLPPVANRIRDAVPRLRDVIRQNPLRSLWLISAAAVAVQCHPVLFFGRSFASPDNGALMLYEEPPTLPGNPAYLLTNTMSSDTGALLFQHLYYPMVERKALAQGELPLWNRYSLCGEPLLGQGQSMFGDPFNFITIAANGAAWAWDIRFVAAHLLLAAGLATAVWLLTESVGAASLTAIAGAFLSFFTFRLTHPANFSVCYSPWILVAWIGLSRSATPRHEVGWLALLLVSNWTVFTSGTVKEATMLMVCLNFAGVVLTVLSPQTAARRLRTIGLAAATGLVLALLSAPGWVSFLNAWRHSYTSYDAPMAEPLPFMQVIGLFDDIFYRQTTYDENVLAPGLNFLLLLGACWWLANPRLWRRDRAGAAIVVAAVPPIALAFGLIPPSAIVRIPFVGNIGHVGNTFSCPLLILGAVLAGCGLRDALARAPDRGWHGAAIRTAAIGCALAALFFVSTRNTTRSPFFAGYAVELAIASAGLLTAGALYRRSAGSLVVAFAICLPLLLWRHCQFNKTFFDHYAFVPGIRSDIHAPSPAAAAIDADMKEPGRVVGWGNTLFPSYNTALGWEGLYGVDAVRNRYYQELSEAFGLERVWIWNAANKEADAPALVPAHDMLNVTHYVATRHGEPRPIAGLKLLQRLDLDVYSSPTAWPRAFFTDRVVRYSAPADFAALVEHGDRRPFAAIQEGEPADVPAASSTEGRRIVAATDFRLTPNTTSFVIDAPGPGVAVLSECYYPDDFRATANGRPVGYFRANHAFRGIALPSAGRYAIAFEYWPRHFTAALWAMAAGILLGVAGAGLLWRSGSGRKRGNA